MKIGFHQLHGRTLWTKAGLMEEKRARRSIISKKSLQSPYLYLVLYHHLISIAVYADLGRPQDSDIRPRSTKTASLPYLRDCIRPSSTWTLIIFLFASTTPECHYGLPTLSCWIIFGAWNYLGQALTIDFGLNLSFVEYAHTKSSKLPILLGLS